MVGAVAKDIVPITPNDDTEFTNPGVLYIETGGDVAVTTVAGNNRTITVPDNFELSVLVKKVLATGTTATGINMYIG